MENKAKLFKGLIEIDECVNYESNSFYDVVEKLNRVKTRMKIENMPVVIHKNNEYHDGGESWVTHAKFTM